MAVTTLRPGVTRYDGPDVAKYLAKLGLPAGGFAIDLGSASGIRFSKPLIARPVPMHQARPAPAPALSLSAIYAARREGARHA